MNSTYRIVLADGTEITSLRQNGNNFISARPVNKDIFIGNLAPVTIYADGIPEVHDHMELVQIVPMPNNEYWFVLRDLSARELMDLQVRADIDFLAMMTDTEL